MNVVEYNKKRSIFEYLNQLDDNERGKIKASINVAKTIYINGGVWKAR